VSSRRSSPCTYAEANRLAASASSLTLLALVLLRRSFARLRAAPPPASQLAAPYRSTESYRSTEPTVVEPVALAARAHARSLLVVVALYLAASGASIVALST